VDLFWTSRKKINGLKHFVLINKYELKNEIFLDFVSVLDSSISFKISKKDFEDSNQWIKGWSDNKKENINFQEYHSFKLSTSKNNPQKISLKENSPFNIS
tara:strand:- start:554 stop:853 length:300 start_codon:yes stop_codon:yes gene_type:complete